MSIIEKLPEDDRMDEDESKLDDSKQEIEQLGNKEDDEQKDDNDNELADEGMLGDADSKHAINQTIEEEKKEEVKKPVVAK